MPFASDVYLVNIANAQAAEEKLWRAPTLGALFRELQMRHLLRTFAKRDHDRYLEARG